MSEIAIQMPKEVGAVLKSHTGKVCGTDGLFNHPRLNISAKKVADVVYHFHTIGDKRFEVALTLEPGTDNSWQGSGYFQGSDFLSPYSQVTAEDDLKSGFVSTLAASVIAGIEVSYTKPITVSPNLVNVSFGLEISAPDDDKTEITKLTIGLPASGISSKIPYGVHLYDATRSTPVMGLYNCTQIVTVRIKVEPEQIIHKPEPKSIKNTAGSFVLEAWEEDGWLNIVRTVKLAHPATVSAEHWPDLRELLLEEADPKNGTIWLK